jgi:hypothetical protein
MSTIHKESATRESVAPKNRTLENALDNKNHSQKITAAQENNDPSPDTSGREPFPTFFELVMQNSEAPLRRAAVYLRVCDEFRRLGDIEAFCESCAEFLNAGREIAKQHALLKIPKVFSHELADRLEEKALALHEQADLMEMKANRVRSLVTL